MAKRCRAIGEFLIIFFQLTSSFSSSNNFEKWPWNCSLFALSSQIWRSTRSRLALFVLLTWSRSFLVFLAFCVLEHSVGDWIEERRGFWRARREAWGFERKVWWENEIADDLVVQLASLLNLLSRGTLVPWSPFILIAE